MTACIEGESSPVSTISLHLGNNVLIFFTVEIPLLYDSVGLVHSTSTKSIKLSLWNLAVRFLIRTASLPYLCNKGPEKEVNDVSTGFSYGNPWMKLQVSEKSKHCLQRPCF
jgi:hypothetical protein